MGEFDVLRGIFGGLIDTKDVTRQAIQAEARGDYAAALKLYGEVSPGILRYSGNYILVIDHFLSNHVLL